MAQAVIAVLAIAGAVALATRLVRSVLRLLLRLAEVTVAVGRAEVSARRGDLTTMAERQTAVARARSARARSAVRVLGWLAAVVAPPLLDVAPAVYAFSSVLWLLPLRPIRGSDGSAAS